MNVKQLKEYLTDLPDDMDITVSDGEGWLYYVEGAHETLTRDRRGKDIQVAVIKPLYSFKDKWDINE